MSEPERHTVHVTIGDTEYAWTIDEALAVMHRIRDAVIESCRCVECGAHGRVQRDGCWYCYKHGYARGTE